MLACALFYLAFKVGELGQRFAVIGEQIANTCDRVADLGERLATTAEQMADAAETAYIRFEDKSKVLKILCFSPLISF
jgi:hypothetical protein